MSFSIEWEQRYAASTHLSIWPWSDVVSLTKRHCRDLGPGQRVLELGCGAGANIPFFQSLGVDYHAVEGSPTIVGQLHQRFSGLTECIVAGDFTQAWPFPAGFDLVLDRASLTCNGESAIRRCLSQVLESLRPGGLFIGIDWYSSRHSDAQLGDMAEDGRTRTNITQGSFAGTGRVHFSDEAHLRDLFAGFELVFLEEKQALRHEPADGHRFASWNLVARKPGGQP
ncbi:class I SAM-dependent methyltransferase [Metapseudomonas otitidis]|uniref:class I SAM-dependent methyltransferase n=1 Tax=Metapseudomonas otitidis TaxID=319939 RepID=UPI0013F66708|nr:class I SAM-dependent methyltransferase [Pseudomonas otitidis]